MLLPIKSLWQQQPSGPVAISERWAAKVISAYLPNVGFITPGRRIDPKRAIVRSADKYGEAAWIDDSNAAVEQRVSDLSFPDTNELSVLVLQKAAGGGAYAGRCFMASSVVFTEGNDTSIDLLRGSFRITATYGSAISAATRNIIWTNNGNMADTSGTTLTVDGLPITSFSLIGTSGTLNGAGNFKVGASPGDGWTWKTKFGLVVWFNKALSPSEVNALSANPWQIFKKPSASLLLSAAGNLSASASGSAQASGTAAISTAVTISAIGVATASGSAQAGVAVSLSAAGVSTASGTANDSVTVSISALGLAQAAGQAGLSASVLMAAAGAAQASGNATLAAQIQAIATGSAQAIGSANLTANAPGALSASGAAVASGSAVLSVTISMQALGSAVASGSANLTGGAPGNISATGSAQASGVATASVTVALTAAGFVQAMGTGRLDVTVPMSAFGMAQASGAAALRMSSAAPHYRPGRIITGDKAIRLITGNAAVRRVTGAKMARTIVGTAPIRVIKG